jgi:hypothetical protein
MIDIGDLVIYKSNPKKLGVVIDKKLIPDEPYASPIERGGQERYPERLALLCYWTTGGANWIDPRRLNRVVMEDS